MQGLIPGSHKCNFNLPSDMNIPDGDHVFQPVCDAGDVIIFSEATTRASGFLLSRLLRLSGSSPCVAEAYACAWLLCADTTLPWASRTRQRRSLLTRYSPGNMICAPACSRCKMPSS